MERQKLMAKGAWTGTLKDDADLSKMNIKEGQQIMLMGTAEVVVAPPVEVQFVEDMTEEQKAEKGTVNPAGLQNLGNTCYMNSTVECFRHMPELREALSQLYPLGPPENFSIALRETFNALDRSVQSLPPIEFVVLLRSLYPQFAQTTSRGGYMQQDAEEFYTTLVNTLQNSLQSSSSSSPASRAWKNLISFDVEDQLTCQESPQEPTVSRVETVNRLVCNIQGGGVSPASSTSASTAVNHLHEGLKLSMEGIIEKRSELLGRDAIWKKQQKITRLSKYICIQFMRFFWKPTPDSLDHSGIKCKIMRPVTYPEIFDVYDYCAPSLQDKLRVNREKAAQAAEEYFNKRFKSDPEATPDQVPESDSMEVVASEAASLKTEEKYDFGEGIPSSFRGHYELMGIVTHKGRSADSGHYIGWVRSAPGSPLWWRYDDDVVTEISTEDVMNLKGGGDWHTAYLAFYRYKEE